jgi:hypothetical protein
VAVLTVFEVDVDPSTGVTGVDAVPALVDAFLVRVFLTAAALVLVVGGSDTGTVVVGVGVGVVVGVMCAGELVSTDDMMVLVIQAVIVWL